MILVTGGTGRLGNQVVRALRSVGLDTRCIVRKGSEYFWLNDTGSAYFFGDLRDPQSLRRALRDVEFVIAAHGVRVEKSDNHHKNVTAEGSMALFDAAAERGVKHVVFISCAAVAHGEDAPGMVAKRAAEEHLVKSGLSYTILRPGLFAANYADLARRLEANGSVFLPGNPQARQSPVHGRDVALMAMAALDLPAVKNQAVDVGGPDVLTIEEAFKIMCEVAGLAPNYWRMPPAALKTTAILARAAGRRWQNYLKGLEASYSHDHVVDGAAVASTFGIPLTPFREAAKAAWADRHPGEDPTAREEKVVHRQFTATIYEPGVIRWDELPEGPPPRQD